MNKKEILEIKKLFTTDKCCIKRICGCYVDGDKNKVMTFRDAFLALQDEEIFKYFKIFRSTLSGSIGKNMLNMEFPLETESEGGTQEFLMKLCESDLKDDDLLDLFYNKIIGNYEYGENYLILLINAAYDVPGKASDGLDMDDASVYVYEHIMCSICPVKLSKEALCYNAQNNSIETRLRDWIVDAPVHGFLFPAFNDRNTDIHNVLYYSKKAEEIQPDFIDGVLGCTQPMTSNTQKTTFHEIISETLGSKCNFETIKSIHENLTAYVEEHKEEPEPVSFGKIELRNAIERSGADNECVSEFEEHFNSVADDRTNFLASNVLNSRTFEIKAPDVTIKVSPDRTDLVETREIDGRKYLLIELTDNIEINGINVKPL